MPKRTTDFQTVVAFVRQHTADSDVTVTESKMLHDARHGTEREVDIAIEGTFDGEQVLTSIEVVERSRKADLPWVEQQIAKHEHLPTTRLVLVSKSGFTKSALRGITAEGGWVEAFRPEIVMDEGKPVVTSVFINQLGLTPRSCQLTVRTPDGTTGQADLTGDATVEIRSGRGESLGVIYQLAYEVLNLRWLGQQIVENVHASGSLRVPNGFSAEVDIAECGYVLRHQQTNQDHLIQTIRLTGAISFDQTEIEFSHTTLGNRSFGSGSGALFGQPAVWVKTTDDAPDVTKISGRALANRAPDAPRLAIGIERFTELLNIEEQPDAAALRDAPDGEILRQQGSQRGT